MTRKPLDVANVNLRIRENLRSQVEHEARKNHTSLNNQIRLMLEDRLKAGAMRQIEDVAADIAVNAARLGASTLLVERSARLMERKERLVQVLVSALTSTRNPEVTKLATTILGLVAGIEEGESS